MDTSRQPQENVITLKEVIIVFSHLKNYLLTNWKTILIVAFLGGIIGLIYATLSPLLYTAQIVFVLENNKEKGSDFASIASKFGLSMGSGTGGLFQDDENIISFTQSRTMITETLFSKEEFNGKEKYLIDHFVDFNDLRSELQGVSFHPNPHLRSRKEDSLIGVFCKMILENNLVVEKPDRKKNIIVASTTASDELFAKVFIEI
jgi:hypothetical protein